MTEERKSQDDQEDKRASLGIFKELTDRGVIVHLEDTKNEVKKDSFLYALFGGGKTVKVVSRKTAKREDVVLYNMPYTKQQYELIKGQPPSPFGKSNNSTIFAERYLT